MQRLERGRETKRETERGTHVFYEIGIEEFGMIVIYLGDGREKESGERGETIRKARVRT